jgi:hypothetical protein
MCALGVEVGPPTDVTLCAVAPAATKQKGAKTTGAIGSGNRNGGPLIENTQFRFG